MGDMKMKQLEFLALKRAGLYDILGIGNRIDLLSKQCQKKNNRLELIFEVMGNRRLRDREEKRIIERERKKRNESGE